MRRTGRMLDWGSGGNEYNMNHPGMDSLDCEYGKPEAMDRGNKHFEQIAGPETPLPVPNGFYHLIRSNNSLGYVQTEEEDFQEMKRLLAPNGTIIIKQSTNYIDVEDRERFIRETKEGFDKAFPWPEYYTVVCHYDDPKESEEWVIAWIQSYQG